MVARRLPIYLLLAGAVPACAVDDPAAVDVVAEEDGDEAVVQRFGYVAVQIFARAAAAGTETDGLQDDGEADVGKVVQVHARFVEAHGMDPDRVRAQLGLIEPEWDGLSPETCRRVEDLHGVYAAAGALEDEPGEVVLLDAGDVEVRVAGRGLEVPVRLVPDLLPFLSGVEYDVRTRVFGGDDLRGAIPVQVQGAGAADGAVPPFVARLEIAPVADPVALADEEGIGLAWSRPSGGGVGDRAGHAGDLWVVLRPAPGRAPSWICRVADDGAARLDLAADSWGDSGLPREAGFVRRVRGRVGPDGSVDVTVSFETRVKVAWVEG